MDRGRRWGMLATAALLKIAPCCLASDPTAAELQAQIKALQDKVAQAWVNFSRTGTPSQPGLEWRPYTADNPQAMVFDTVSQCYPLHDDKLASLLPATGGRGGRGGRGGPA